MKDPPTRQLRLHADEAAWARELSLKARTDRIDWLKERDVFCDPAPLIVDVHDDRVEAGARLVGLYKYHLGFAWGVSNERSDNVRSPDLREPLGDGRILDLLRPRGRVLSDGVVAQLRDRVERRRCPVAPDIRDCLDHRRAEGEAMILARLVVMSPASLPRPTEEGRRPSFERQRILYRCDVLAQRPGILHLITVRRCG